MSCGLRDVLAFEADEKPSVLVASSAFEVAANAIAAALGQANARRVFVTHPITDRTDSQIHELARQAVDGILAALASES